MFLIRCRTNQDFQSSSGNAVTQSPASFLSCLFTHVPMKSGLKSVDVEYQHNADISVSLELEVQTQVLLVLEHLLASVSPQSQRRTVNETIHEV